MRYDARRMSPASVPSGAQPALVVRGTIVAGKYRIEEMLGKGGMGFVVRATHLQLGGAVALKFLHADLTSDLNHVERFLREARAAARVRSEHIASVYDVGTLPAGEPFMVLELLLGEDLSQVSKERGPLPVGEAVGYVVQACRGIAEAHRVGIVHRDLKPGNLFVTQRPDGSPLVKVLDFGISKITDGTDQSLTATGDVLGSPLYMSPEQIRDARKVDATSDVWALGTILHKLLTGRAPFAAETSSGTLASIVVDPPPPVRRDRPDVPAAIEAVILRCLDKVQVNRFASADDLAAALLAAMAAPFGQEVAAPVGGPSVAQAFVSVPSQTPPAPLDETRMAALGTISIATSTHGDPRKVEARRGGATAALVGVAALVLAGVLVAGFVRHNAGKDAPRASDTGASDETPASTHAPAPSIVTSEVTATTRAIAVAPQVDPSALTSAMPSAAVATASSSTSPMTGAPAPRVPTAATPVPSPTLHQQALPRYGQD